MRISTEIDSLQQLQALAKAFSSVVKPGTVVLFEGDLGSGKTTFIKFLVKELGGTEEVTSPTYTLLNTYEANFPVFHFDMYRLSSAEEAREAGFEEFFDKTRLKGAVFVEWPENVEGLRMNADFVVNITKLGQNRRKFVIKEGKDAGN